MTTTVSACKIVGATPEHPCFCSCHPGKECMDCLCGRHKLKSTPTHPPTETNKAIIYHDYEMFGGNREKAILRDGEKCVKCSIAREEHKKKYNKDLVVDHINGLGLSVPREKKDNRLENLQTLCSRCHGIKESVDKDFSAMGKVGGAIIKNKYGKEYYQKMADHMNKKLKEGQMEKQMVDNQEISLTKNQYEVLTRMDSDYSYGFNHFINESMDRKTVKKTMHELRDLGLVEFSRGLINDDGQSCGSGYGIKDWYVVQKLLEKSMTTKVKPTVEKWDSLENKLLSVGCEVEATCISEEEGLKRIKALLSHSVQEAKAERDREWMMGMYQMFGNSKGGRVGMAILASLKQEEEK